MPNESDELRMQPPAAVKPAPAKAAPKKKPVAHQAAPIEKSEPGLTADLNLSPEVDDRATHAADVERIRALRRPFGALTQKLALPVRPGYHRHWFNDEAGRVDEAKESGWSHVLGRDGKPLKRTVGTGRDRGVLNAYAMEIPEVFWQEDMTAKHAVATAKVDAIREAPAKAKTGQAKAADRQKFYNPREEAGVDPVQVVKA